MQNGVVHRDLKLENILLDQDLNVKVTYTNRAFSSLCDHVCLEKQEREFPLKNKTRQEHFCLRYFYVLLSHPHCSSTHKVQGLLKEPSSHFFALLGCSSPWMGAVHGLRGIQGIQWQSCQSEGIILSTLCPSKENSMCKHLSGYSFIGSPHQWLTASAAGNDQASVLCMFVLFLYNSCLMSFVGGGPSQTGKMVGFGCFFH